MNNIALQIERSVGGSVAASGNVVFDMEVLSQGNIGYDNATGVITLLEMGRYAINWWVATQSAAVSTGAVFALSSSQGDHIEGDSPLRTGQAGGTGIIEVTSAPVTLSLVNQSAASFFFPGSVPIQASLTVGQIATATGIFPPTYFNKIYVANFFSNNVSVIDGVTNTLVTLIPMGANPYGIIDTNPNTGRVYTAHNGGVSVIDATTDSVITTIPSSGALTGLGVNRFTNRIYASNTTFSNLLVIDGNTNAIITSIPIGNGNFGVAVNPLTNRIYTANEISESVSVVDGNTNTVLASISTSSSFSPTWIAINPRTNKIYVTDFSNQIFIIDGFSNTVIASPALTSALGGIGVNPTTNRIYVAEGDQLTVLNGTTDAVVTNIPLGSSIDSQGVGVNAFTNGIYVASNNQIAVLAVSGNTNAVTATIPTGGTSPRGVAVMP